MMYTLRHLNWVKWDKISFIQHFRDTFSIFHYFYYIQSNQAPLADSHEIKAPFKAIFWQNKGCFTEILTKIKSKLTSGDAKYQLSRL